MSNNFSNKNLDTLKPENLNWNSVQSDMKNKLGMDVYESWLKKINFIDEFNNYILLSVPTRFIRDWITSRYLDQILQIVRNYRRDLIRIEFKIIDQKIKTKNFDNDESLIASKDKISFIKDSHLQYSRIDPNKRFYCRFK